MNSRSVAEPRTPPEAEFGLTRSVVPVGDEQATVFVREGDGPALLFMQGGYSDAVGDFGPIVLGLDPHLAVYAPVLRGHGGELVADEESNIGPVTVADDMVALAGALGLKRPVMGGFSFGGRAAMLSAKRVDAAALVLIGARFAGFDREEFDVMMQLVFRFSPHWADPEWDASRRAMDRGIVGYEIDPESWAADVGDLPILLLRGERDRVATTEQMQLYLDHLPNVRLVTLEGHGHRLMDTAPGETAVAINDFLHDVLSPDGRVPTERTSWTSS